MTDIKVVHVDDDEQFLRMSSKFMKKESDDIELFSAENTSKALNIIEDEDIDCVVSDYDMPDSDGLEFLKMVREDYPDVPFILFTGKGSEEIASEAISAGVTDYLQKEGVKENYSILANRIKNAVGKKRTQQALKESEEKFKNLFKNANDAIFLMKDGVYIDCNKRAEKMVGTDKENILGRSPLEFAPERQPDGVKTTEKIKEKTQEALEGNTAVFEWKGKDIDGNTVDLEVSLSTITQDGEVVAQGITRPINEIERPLEPLYRSTKKLMNASSLKEISEVTVESAREILGFSGTAVRFYNEENNKLEIISYGNDLESRDERPDFDVDASPHGEAYQSGETVICDIGEEDDYGREQFSQTMYIPLSDYGTLSLGVFEGTFTERDQKLAELLGNAAVAALDNITKMQELRRLKDESQEKFETIVEEARNAVLIFQDQKIVFANKRTAEILDTEEEKVEGEGITKFIAPEYREKVAERYKKRMKGEDVKGRYRIEAKTSEGSRVPLELSVSKVRYKGDDAIIGIARDISETIKRQEELERKNERLENFVKVLSHDLRNPLNVAEGYLEIIDNSNAEEGVDEVRESLTRIEDIIDNTLEIARHGSTVEEKEELKLEDLAEKAWENVESFDCELEVKENITLEAESSRLLRAFENIFSNAIEHGDASKIMLGKLGDDRIDGFYIQNNGDRIPKDVEDKMFEQGFSTGESTGFGLSIVKSIFNAHGWDIDLSHEDGDPRFEIKFQNKKISS